MTPTNSNEQIAEILKLASEYRLEITRQAFREGPDGIRSLARQQIARNLAGYELSNSYHTIADLDFYAFDHMASNPKFKATVEEMLALVEEFISAALTFRLNYPAGNGSS